MPFMYRCIDCNRTYTRMFHEVHTVCPACGAKNHGNQVPRSGIRVGKHNNVVSDTSSCPVDAPSTTGGRSFEGDGGSFGGGGASSSWSESSSSSDSGGCSGGGD